MQKPCERFRISVVRERGGSERNALDGFGERSDRADSLYARGADTDHRTAEGRSARKRASGERRKDVHSLVLEYVLPVEIGGPLGGVNDGILGEGFEAVDVGTVDLAIASALAQSAKEKREESVTENSSRRDVNAHDLAPHDSFRILNLQRPLSSRVVVGGALNRVRELDERLDTVFLRDDLHVLLDICTARVEPLVASKYQRESDQEREGRTGAIRRRERTSTGKRD